MNTGGSDVLPRCARNAHATFNAAGIPQSTELPSANRGLNTATFAAGATAQGGNPKRTCADGTHEITAQAEYISALLLARAQGLPQRNDAIRGGISAFHYRTQICRKV